MPKFSITFSRKRWEHLTKDIEVANLEEAEKAVAAYLSGCMDLDDISSGEDWDWGNLDCEFPEVQISNEDLAEAGFYPEDYCWPNAEPAPLPPPPPPPNKKFVVQVTREVTDLLAARVEVEAAHAAAAIEAAQALYDADKIELTYLYQVDDGVMPEYEILFGEGPDGQPAPPSS